MSNIVFESGWKSAIHELLPVLNKTEESKEYVNAKYPIYDEESIHVAALLSVAVGNDAHCGGFKTMVHHIFGKCFKHQGKK